MKGIIIAILVVLVGLSHASVWNSPHKASPNANVRYAAISGSPKTLDPAKAYSSNEIDVIAQIYEPPLQYHLKKRPYQLVPLASVGLPTVRYYAKDGQQLPLTTDPKRVAKSVYDVRIQPGIRYQPHPAFAKNKQGHFLYDRLTSVQINLMHRLSDFKYTGSREVTAADYVYQIKRIASPKLHSPIFGIMSKYIVGLSQLDERLKKIVKKSEKNNFLDLRQFNLQGVKTIGRYRYQITLNGVYPQFINWLAMTFFSPIPWEADKFYSQPGLAQHNISFSWYPIGTGPYMLLENNPNKRMVLRSNPNYTGHSEARPKAAVDKVVLVLDKESIPRWNKFMQGYYDKSGVGADSFDQAIKIDKTGKALLTQKMIDQGIRLQSAVEPGIYYIGFNMLDSVVGGYGEKKNKLRQAIAIAIDYEEYISIFLNGRGIPGQGLIPPGIFGYLTGEHGHNPYIYQWVNGKARRKPIEQARALLAEAGYPAGIDQKTQRPLILNYDVATSGSPDDKAHFSWLRDQFAKLGIRLNIRATLYNRFQDKVRSGKAQLFSWGWLADYPDPENFLFLIYGPNAKVRNGGENATNYSNPVADALFLQIRSCPNGAARQRKINQLMEILRRDSPIIFGFHPITFVLSHQWNQQITLNPMARNSMKYERINTTLRAKLQQQWNQPHIWPLIIAVIFLLLMIIPLVIAYRRRERTTTIRRIKQKRD